MKQSIRHTRSQRYQLYALGLILFSLAALFLSKASPNLDESSAGIISVVVGLCGWYMADFWITRRKGLLLRYEWSPRQNRLLIILQKQWKTLFVLRLDVADYSGNDPLISVWNIKQAIIAELTLAAPELDLAEQIHFVGFDEEDAGIFMRMIEQAMTEAKKDSV